MGTVARRTARRASKPKAPKAARKASKPMKAKRVSKRKAVRKPKRVTKKSMTGSYRQVWNGTKTYTKGGLTKSSLMLNKNNKVVSKKTHAVGQKASGYIKGWNVALSKARAELGITGFVTINRGEMGVKLYKLAKEYHC